MGRSGKNDTPSRKAAGGRQSSATEPPPTAAKKYDKKKRKVVSPKTSTTDSRKNSKKAAVTMHPSATATTTLPSINWMSLTAKGFDAKLNEMDSAQLKALIDYLKAVIRDSEDPETKGTACERMLRVHSVALGRQGGENDATTTLGAFVKSLGRGSKAGSHKEEVNRAVDSLAEDAEDRKGRMLCHFLYREFLNYYYGAKEIKEEGFEEGSTVHAEATETSVATTATGDGKVPAAASTRNLESKPSASQDDDDQESSPAHAYSLEITGEDSKTFAALYKSMEAKTSHGLVAKKNKDGKTPEPCQTSFLGAFVNNMITPKLGSGDDMVVWLSEYAYFREGMADDKCPRQDGNMAIRDPANDSVWRAILSYEAKLEDFTDYGNYESRSNSIDAISRFGWVDGKPSAKPWPLLAVRHVVPTCKFSVFALSPDSPSHYKMVPMLTETGTSNFFRAIMAVGRAGQSFYKKVQENGACPDFCICNQNVCLQTDGNKRRSIFKSFVDTETRHHHLRLCQNYISPDARLWDLGERGCYLELPYVGPVLPSDKKCSVLRFSEIADTIRRLHDEGLVHGDIHLENCIFGGDRGTLIDFDLVGKADETKYPSSLYDLDERVGGRHEEVVDAIHNRKSSIAELPMKKEHDWTSFGKVMKLFRPVNEEDSTTWQKYVRNPTSLGSDMTCPPIDFTVEYFADH